MSDEITYIQGASDQQAVAILPGKLVSTFAIELPDISEAKLNKIIPSTLVDLLAGDIEDIHFSILGKNEKGQFIVAVCDAKWMNEIKVDAAQNGIDLVAIWPDYTLIDVPEEGITIVSKDGFILGRRQDGTGFSVKDKFADHVIGENKTSDGKISTIAPAGVGLATGKYSKKPPVLVYIKAVKRLAAIFGLALVSWIAYSLMIISDNEQARLEYADAAVELFKKTYPEETRIVNVEAQMRNLISSSANTGGMDFLHFANDLFEAVNETSGVSLEQLGFENSGDLSQATVTIASTDFAQISEFEGHLNQFGYRFEQGGSSQNGEKIFSDYLINGAGQ